VCVQNGEVCVSECVYVQSGEVCVGEGVCAKWGGVCTVSVCAYSGEVVERGCV